MTRPTAVPMSSKTILPAVESRARTTMRGAVGRAGNPRPRRGGRTPDGRPGRGRPGLRSFSGPGAGLRRRRPLERLADTGGPVDLDVLEDVLEERVGLVLVEVAGVHELAGEDLLGLREHLLLAGRQALLGVADGQVADHLGDLEDVARLELVAVVLVATAPVLGHLGGVAAQHLEDLLDDVGLDDLAQAGAVGVLDRDHDGHVVVEDLDGEVLAQLTEHFLLLDLHDLAGAVMRIHDLVADWYNVLKPPTVVARPRYALPSTERRRGESREPRADRPRPQLGAATAVAHRRPGRRHASNPARPGFDDAALRLAAGTQLARQADLPERGDAVRQRYVTLGRGDGEGNGEVGRGFVDADSACNM